VKLRAIADIDADLTEVRKRLLDSVRGDEQWTTAWMFIDRLLEERYERNYPPKHAKESNGA
jgi:hypothetical protein